MFEFSWSVCVCELRVCECELSWCVVLSWRMCEFSWSVGVQLESGQFSGECVCVCELSWSVC